MKYDHHLRVGIIALLSALSCAAGLASPAGPTTQSRITVILDPKTLPSSPGYHTIKAMAQVGDKKIPLAAAIFLPAARFEHDEPLPIVVTLHNRGDSGSDGRSGLAYEGLAALLASDKPDTRGTGEKPRNPVNLRKQGQFIGLVPQCPSGFGWETPPVGEILDRLITQIAAKYNGDEDRVYLTGFSYGGSSTWRVAMQTPGRYAAIAPLDGRHTPDPVHDVAALSDVGIYLGVGGDDGEFIKEAQPMRDALIAARHKRFLYHVVPHGNHWNYACVYTDPEFWEWMFSQRRPGALPATRPSTLPVAGATTRDAAPGPVVSAAVSKTQTVLCQFWRDIPGMRVKDLTDDPGFPRYPTQQVYLDQMEIEPNQEAGFGTVLRGVIHPPLTGEYTFYIASDNQGELWLSSDDKPEHLAKIAVVSEWTLPRNWMRDSAQKSKPVRLEEGKSYLLEARHKSGGGDNHLSVAWKWPDGTFEGPLRGTHVQAPPEVKVEEPKVVEIHLGQMPVRPGTYRMKLEVDCLGRRQEMGMAIVLPKGYEPGKTAGLIYLADSETAADGEGFRMDGPVAAMSKGELAGALPLVVIAPQVPSGASYDKIWVQRCLAAAVMKMLGDFEIDPNHVYLTGSGSGGTACWHLALLMPGRFAAVASICGLQVQSPDLLASLNGTAVRMVTGCFNGRATDCANRMKDALTALKPSPEVVYEMKMGSEVAAAYYAKREFYQWFLGKTRASGGPNK